MRIPNDRVTERRLLHAALDKTATAIQKIRYLRLENQLLEGVNPEINTDRQVLMSRMEALGFRPGIVTRLRELDQKIYQARKSTDFRDCMDAVRIVFEEIVEDAGRKAAAFSGRGRPTVGEGGNFSPWRKLLVDTKALTGDEGQLFAALYAYLSNSGTHRLESRPEQVRITKNIAIECGLLVVGRVQAMQPTSSSASGSRSV